MVEENARRLAKMAVLPTVAEELAERYERAKSRAGVGSEYLEDAAVVNARLDDLVASAEVEILSAQPGGPRTQAQLNRSVIRDQEALARGVTLRTLYRDTVRQNSITGEYVRTMSVMGAEYKTLIGHFERCIVVDRRVAFVTNHLVQGAPEHAAWQVTDRAMVALICAVFDDGWKRAREWHGEFRGRSADEQVDTVSAGPGAVVRTTPRQREIMRELVADRDQKAIAVRMGISTRTVAAEINELKAMLGASSIPGLAFKWALSPDRLIDDADLSAEPAGVEDVAA